jgi:hypothetical protein
VAQEQRFCFERYIALVRRFGLGQCRQVPPNLSQCSDAI